MRSPRATFRSLFDNPVIAGTLTILVILVAVYLSYISENGLPFIPTYNLNVQVADGGELNKNVDVRIGGDRVGQVLKITPEPANKRYGRPFAQVELAIDKNLEPLPADTHYQVRLSSILGGQYVELFPGTVKKGQATVPDGGTLTLSASAKTNHNIPYIDISQAFAVFGPKTRTGLRSVAQGFGNALAGRGTELNDATVATAQLLGPLQNLFNLFSAPSTQLTSFIDGLASTTAALAPVAPNLISLLDTSGTTAAAFDVPAFGQTIDELPSTEVVGTRVLTQATPVLAQLASISRSFEPAARYLPTAASYLDTVLRTSPTTLRLLTPVSAQLETTIGAATQLAADPAATQSFNVLGVNDLGTTGSSAFLGLGAILNTVSGPQFACNVAGLWVRNFASSLSEGNADGNWLRIGTLLDPTQLVQSSSGTPASDLHIDVNPQEGGGQCQGGNETYTGAQAIDDPGHTSATVAETAPPAGVYALGQKAGLVP